MMIWTPSHFALFHLMLCLRSIQMVSTGMKSTGAMNQRSVGTGGPEARLYALSRSPSPTASLPSCSNIFLTSSYVRRGTSTTVLLCVVLGIITANFFYTLVSKSKAALHMMLSCSLSSNMGGQEDIWPQQEASMDVEMVPNDTCPPLLGLPVPLATAMGSLTCLKLFGCISPRYHPSFPLNFSCFSALKHLTIMQFRLQSFTHLRVIICGLPNLREVDLGSGSLVSKAGTTNPSPGFPPVKAPRLSKVTLHDLKDPLLYLLAQWMTSTEICYGCTNLDLAIGVSREGGTTQSIFRMLGPSLTALNIDERIMLPCMYISWLVSQPLTDGQNSGTSERPCPLHPLVGLEPVN